MVARLVFAVLALIAVAGCEIGSGNSVSTGSSTSSSSSGGVSSSVSCVDDRCEIAVAGDTSGSRLGVLGRELRIPSIEDGAVVVTVSGEERRIAAGETATVGGLAVEAVSAGAGRAELVVRRG